MRKIQALLIVALFVCPAYGAGNAFGGQVSVTTSAQRLTTLLSLSANKNARQLSLRIDPASANTIYCGTSSAVTNVPANACVVLVAATTNSFTYGDAGPMTVATDDIFCVATTGTTTMFVWGAE